MEICNQPLDMHLLIAILRLMNQQMAIHINQAIKMGAMIKPGRNQAFITAVYLIIQVGTG